MGPEEGHLAATVKEYPAAQGNPRRDIRCRRGRQSRPIRQERARGNGARRRRRAKIHSFVGERDTPRGLAKSDDNSMWSPPRLQSRPADQRMTKTNSSNSFIRDQDVRFRPEKGDPILKEYRSDFQRRLRSIEWEKTHTQPIR